jgi:hypothetical protein
MATAPTAVTIFAYQVGFGDCFLLRFAYADRPRFVLVDFGTTGLPAEAESKQLTTIANDIADKCGGRLDAVVATHRHADHISGFATNKDGTAPGDIIRKLKPRVVIQPWTEEPDLPVDALKPNPAAIGSNGARAALQSMHRVAENVVAFLDASPKGIDERTLAELRFIGEDNLKNKAAVRNLATMGEKTCYVFHGSKSGLERILPGIKTHILGPPTLAQTASISKQKARDIQEYWHFALKHLEGETGEGAAAPAQPAFPDHIEARGGKLPLPSRWLAYRTRRARGEQLLSLVRSLDKQMNNTSVILLFESKKKKLLFPGDAQIENWQFALNNPAILKMLGEVDVYKVGHHGSLNATPRTMWDNFAKKGKAKTKGRMTSLLSTRTGKHGTAEASTEVPRTTLLKELRAHTCLHSTHMLAADKLYDEIEIAL